MIRGWLDGDGLLGESVEEQPPGLGAPSVEAEGEFVEVVVEMLVLNAALVSTEQPPLEKRSNGVDSRHDIVGRLRAAADDGDLVAVAGRRQPGIAAPSVGVYLRPRRHGTLDEGEQAVRRHVLDAPKADSADAATTFFSRHRDNGLGLGFPSPLALFGAADIGFVDLDCARKAIPAGPDHRPAQLVEPSPSCLVAAQSEHPLQTQGADTVLLAGDEPQSQEPHPQRLACVLEHGAGRQRRAPMTTPAPQQPTRHRPRFTDHSAVRAGKPVRPAQLSDIVPAPRLGMEPIIHLLERPWVINPRNRVLRIFHPSTLPSSRRSVKGIPVS